MQVMVRVSGVLAREIGRARLTVTLPEQATIQDLLQHLQAEYPQLSVEIEQVVAIINGVHQPTTAVLQDGQEVALLLPIAGG